MLALPACVTTQTSPAPGFPYNRDDTPGRVGRPSGARPENQRVVLSVEPLGVMPYDGVSLPLLSPDGRFAAASIRQAPSWPALLASDSAIRTPADVQIAVFPLGPGLNAGSGLPVILPPGCVLGRSADAEGFLVERDLDDGSRWIGKVSWVSRSVRWLIADEHFNFHATLLPAADPGAPGPSLAFARRRVGRSQSELVIRPLGAPGAEQRLALDHASIIMPTVSGDPAALFVVVLAEKPPADAGPATPPADAGERPVYLAQVALAPAPAHAPTRGTDTPPNALACIIREEIARVNDPADGYAVAHQALSVVPTPWPGVEPLAWSASPAHEPALSSSPAIAGAGASDDAAAAAPVTLRSSASSGLLFFSARLGGMAWLAADSDNDAALGANRAPASAASESPNEPVFGSVRGAMLLAPQSLGGAMLARSARDSSWSIVLGEPESLTLREFTVSRRAHALAGVRTDARSGALRHSAASESFNSPDSSISPLRAPVALLQGVYAPFVVIETSNAQNGAITGPSKRAGSAPNGGNSPDGGRSLLLVAPPAPGEDSVVRILRARPLLVGQSAPSGPR